MGFFDLLKAKKAAAKAAPAKANAAPASTPPQAQPTPAPAPTPSPELPKVSVAQRLISARSCLDSNDLAGAQAIYEKLLEEAGDRPDVLVTISGDLGVRGHVQEIIDWIAPRYDAQRHGPATGLNVLQAYLVLRNPEAAQHVLDILFSLKHPELEERLYGFSNAIGELMAARKRGEVQVPVVPPETGQAGQGEAAAAPKPSAAHVHVVTVSKPIWSYGHEALASEILPPKDRVMRRVAFAQLAVLGVNNLVEALLSPEDELGRLSRAIPLWLTETLHFGPAYSAVAAVGVMEHPEKGGHFALFASEWTPEHIQQFVSTSREPLDFVFTGSLRQENEDTEMVLRLWEVKRYRERKQFVVRWNPASKDAELLKLVQALRLFMEHHFYPEEQNLAYAVPVSPAAWLETLGASLGLFLCEKKLISAGNLRPIAEDLAKINAGAPSSAAASLAALAFGRRAVALGLAENPGDVVLFQNPLVEKARQL